MDGHLEITAAVEPKKPNRTARMKNRIGHLHSEVQELEALTETLLGHLEQAISPRITDADRIRYRCMIQDIRAEIQKE